MATSLDSSIDALYQEPLSSFTEARNALAKTLSGEQAREVKKLPKPTLVPWAVNQLYWKSRHTYERLLKSGAALREAQFAALQGKKADIRKASEAHRNALADAVEEAVRLAAQHGSNPDAEPLARMLEAVSLAAERPEHPGRFTEVLKPAGFEALSGITPFARLAPPAGPAEPPSGAPAAKPDRAAERRAREAERLAQKAEAAARREAAKRAERQKTLDAAVADAERDVERAQKALAAAERALAAARERADANRL